MAYDYRKIFNCSVCPVFELAAFSFPEPVEDKRHLFVFPGRAYLHAELSFKGELATSGRVELAMSEKLCLAIAGNMLGQDADSPAVLEQKNDTISEIANVLCGRVITEAFGTSAVFDLTIPEVRSMSAEEFRNFKDSSDVFAYKAEGEILLVRAEINSL